MRLSAVVLASILLSSCGSSPTVSEENASVEEVTEKVRKAAGDDGLIRPGKWESSVTIENMSIPGMPPETAARMQAMMEKTRTAEVCLTEEEVKKPGGEFFAGNDQCRYDHFTMKKGKVDAAMRCSSDAGTQVMEMDGTYSPTSYTMRMKSRTEGGPSGEAMTMQMHVESKRIGECDEPKG